MNYDDNDDDNVDDNDGDGDGDCDDGSTRRSLVFGHSSMRQPMPRSPKTKQGTWKNKANSVTIS